MQRGDVHFCPKLLLARGVKRLPLAPCQLEARPHILILAKGGSGRPALPAICLAWASV